MDLVSVSPREPGTKALAWELVRLRGGGKQRATRGLPATASSGLSVITRRYDQPDHPHRDKPVFSAPNVHRYSSQPPTQPPTPSEEHRQTGSLRRSRPGAQWNGGRGSQLGLWSLRFHTLHLACKSRVILRRRYIRAITERVARQFRGARRHFLYIHRQRQPWHVRIRPRGRPRG